MVSGIGTIFFIKKFVKYTKNLFSTGINSNILHSMY